MWKKMTLSGIFLLIISILEEISARNSLDFVFWHNRYCYKSISQIFCRISSLLPFSIVEGLLYVLIIYVVVGFIYGIYRKHLKAFTASLVFIASLLFFLYVNNCGINYYMPGFVYETGMTLEEYQVQDLDNVCNWLVDHINEYADQVARDEDYVMCSDDAGWRKEAVEAMNITSEEEPVLSGFYPQPKPVKVSYILSVQQVTGVYSPFTVEANYNEAIPSYNKPFTMCHELSHLRGFMQEKEANYIGFLACIHSEAPAFRYSGYLNAFVYCSNALYRVDYDRYAALWERLHKDAIADILDNNAFWKKYEGKPAEIHEKINNTYLIANGQKEGVSGYDYMVDLVVAYYKATVK